MLVSGPFGDFLGLAFGGDATVLGLAAFEFRFLGDELGGDFGSLATLLHLRLLQRGSFAQLLGFAFGALAKFLTLAALLGGERFIVTLQGHALRDELPGKHGAEEVPVL